MSALVRAINEEVEKLRRQIVEGHKQFNHIRFMFAESNKSTLEQYKFSVSVEIAKISIAIPPHFDALEDAYTWEMDPLGNIYLDNDKIEHSKIHERVAEQISVIAKYIAAHIVMENSHA